MLPRLKKRPDFTRLQKRGAKAHAPAFVLLALPNELPHSRVGFTATKKTIGNAVARNRAKRRLRALVDSYFKEHPQKNQVDLVLIARLAVLEHDFSTMEKDFHTAFKKLLNAFK